MSQSEQRRVPVRAKEPINFNIEAMPTKVKFRFNLDENGEQALLGDFYNVHITMEPEDITITEFSLQVESVDLESTVLSPEVQLESQNLMVSQIMNNDSNAASTINSLNSSQISGPGGIRTVNVQRDPASHPGLIKKADSFTAAPLAVTSIPFNKQKTQLFKDIEIFYLINPQRDSSTNDLGSIS